MPYKPAWRARERLRDIIDSDEGVSFSFIPDWIQQVGQSSSDEASPHISTKVSADYRFEALFVMIGPIRATLHNIRPFYALDGTHTRSRYNLTLLIIVGIDTEDHVLPLAFALVPIENETWWSWFCEQLVMLLKTLYHLNTSLLVTAIRGF